MPGESLPLRVVGLGGFGGFHEIRAIITQLGIRSQSNVQFLQTLRNFVYVYSFGERMGDIVIGGLAMPGDCAFTDPTSGLERVLSYYAGNRLSTQGDPVAIAIGANITYAGFLIGFEANVNDPRFGLAQFSLAFKHLQTRQ